MNGFWHINLIHLFSFYLAMMFLASLYRRTEQYRAVGGLVLTVPGRWPRLFQLVKQHGTIFLTWQTYLPALVALSLMAINYVASKYVMPTANTTPAVVADHWLSWPFVLGFGAAMLAVDTWFLIAVSPIDRHELSKYLDEAEYWLRSWTAPVVHFFTLGTINPRQMVRVEVQKALVEASKLINTSLWWVVTQMGLRVGFGLSLWLTYALTH